MKIFANIKQSEEIVTTSSLKIESETERKQPIGIIWGILENKNYRLRKLFSEIWDFNLFVTT